MSGFRCQDIVLNAPAVCPLFSVPCFLSSVLCSLSSVFCHLPAAAKPLGEDGSSVICPVFLTEGLKPHTPNRRLMCTNHHNLILSSDISDFATT